MPDSPENIWFLERDGGVFARMIDRLHSRYGIDRERVYLTGFSNGGMMTREAGTRYPQLFAALSPWNAPPAETWPGFAEGGWQMPCFIYLGDNDPSRGARKNRCWSRCSGQTVVRLCGRPGLCAGCDIQRRKPLHCRAWVYRGRTLWHSGLPDAQGVPRVCVTVMKNMPHGAIHDESRAAWEFMRRYRRPGNGKAVETVPHTESTETECAKQKEERLK
ncbi:MAG: hypothetical protein ACLSBB_18260 [Ruthenibacterium lactatiformans]